jgi:DNA (cytosine-5)-methyltransferase 1
MDLPFPTITASGTQQALTYAVLKRPPCDGSLVAAFIAEYYSNGSQWSSLEQPLPTIVTGDRFQLITVTIRGVDFVVTDICQRMLTPRELACAQGFPKDYVLTGTKSEQRKRLGNSVCPGLAAAVIRSQLNPRKKAA